MSFVSLPLSLVTSFFKSTFMFNHYLKTTYRHLKRSKINFAFKLGGLTLALLSLLVIVLYVSYQLSFDKFHADFENIYRVKF